MEGVALDQPHPLVQLEDGLDHGLGPEDRMLDERTEVILAATFLVMVVLSFIRCVFRSAYYLLHLTCAVAQMQTLHCPQGRC